MNEQFGTRVQCIDISQIVVVEDKEGVGLHDRGGMGGRSAERFARWKKIGRQVRAKVYIIRLCIVMLLCWDNSN